MPSTNSSNVTWKTEPWTFLGPIDGWVEKPHPVLFRRQIRLVQLHVVKICFDYNFPWLGVWMNHECLWHFGFKNSTFEACFLNLLYNPPIQNSHLTSCHLSGNPPWIRPHHLHHRACWTRLHPLWHPHPTFGSTLPPCHGKHQLKKLKMVRYKDTLCAPRCLLFQCFWSQ